MNRNVRLLFTPSQYGAILRHLYQADRAEHAGGLLCGICVANGRVTLTVRDFVPAVDGRDYVITDDGHGRLQPLFVHEQLIRAASERLVYIGIHNHFSDDRVSFSEVDLASHARAYPTYLSLTRGMPVGAAVFGRRSVEVDVWMPGGNRLALEQAILVGHGLRRLWSHPSQAPTSPYDETFDRQLPFLRAQGQGLIRAATIGVVGLGGIGMQLLEPLVRLGITRFVVIDPDHLERSNYSRVHGALLSDLPEGNAKGESKVAIARRLIHGINPQAFVTGVKGDVARGDVHRALLECDYVFLAADTAEARLVCNALAHQYFIPTAQLGTKIVVTPDATVQKVFGVVRQIRPGSGCLWCNGLIDRVALANASKSHIQRNAERYGLPTTSPAVVTLNSEVTGRALNDFVMSFASTLMPLDRGFDFTLLDLVAGSREEVLGRKDRECPFCSSTGALGRGDSGEVPAI